MSPVACTDPTDLLVIFGITGDLAHKMTFRALYRLERRSLLDCPIIGVAADDLSTAQLVDLARTAIAEGCEAIDESVFARFAERLSYLHGDVNDAALYKRLAKQIGRIGRGRRPLFYLEMPPALFGPIVERLDEAGLLTDAAVAVEKPFGHDLASARDLNARLRKVLREDQLLRVDHFLGKEPVIELEYLRFANLALARIWDRDSVAAVQITMAEDFGVQDRGAFYDPVGALRDVVQNHLLQVLALVTMEPPSGPDAEPYERLLHAAMTGDHQLFAREDSVEETWRIVQPLLDEPPEIHRYERGSWGPAAAARLTRGHPRWQKPFAVGKQ